MSRKNGIGLFIKSPKLSNGYSKRTRTQRSLRTVIIVDEKYLHDQFIKSCVGNDVFFGFLVVVENVVAVAEDLTMRMSMASNAMGTEGDWER